MSSENTLYPVMDMVIMQPGVRVFCDDQDERWYDHGGIIVGARSLGGGQWEFDIVLDGNEDKSPITLDDRQIWPDGDATRDAPPPPNALKIFLCHGREDKEPIRKVYGDLKRSGMDPWLDEENLLPGIEWEPAIQAAVRNSDVVLVCLSRTSTTKTGFVQKEIRIALDAADERPEGAVYIVPAKLEDCELPGRLSRWQTVNLYETGGYSKLLRALEAHPNRTNADAEQGRRTYWKRSFYGL